MTISPEPGLPAVVLDTNVALDWLVFADPSVSGLAERIERRAWRWLACERMRDELALVLMRPAFAARGADCKQILTSFDRWSTPVTFATNMAMAPPLGLTCLDPDDQVFVDLALDQKARWLFTRDKALLALAPSAGRLGLGIVAPARWRPEEATAP
jgi:predicted nucleic acid-binding protein